MYARHVLQAIFAPMAMARYGLPSLPGLMYGLVKRWYGAPMAAIVKGMGFLGAVRMRLPRDVCNKLRELQDLYVQHPGFGASHTNGVPPHQPQGESRVSPGEDASGMDTSTQHVEQQLGTNDQPQNLQSLQRSSDQHEKECDAVSDSAIEMWCCSGIREANEENAATTVSRQRT